MTDAERSSLCSKHLTDISLGTLRDVLRETETTVETVEAAEQSLWDGLIDIANRYVDPSKLHAGTAGDVREAIRLATAVASGAIRGFDARMAPHGTRSAQLLQRGLGVPVDARDFLDQVRELAERPEYQSPFTMAEYIRDGAPSVESVVLTLALEFERLGLPPRALGPKHFEMVKTILQYAPAKAGDRGLEIGPGDSVNALALRPYLPLDIYTAGPSDLSEAARPHYAVNGVHHIRGHFPEPGLMESLATHAPYQIIYALDVFTSGAFEGAASVAVILAHLKRNLAESGTLILMHDFAEPPIFTRADAERAGLHVVRWNVPREVAPAWQSLLRYPAGAPGGRLRVFVLNKGGDPGDRVREYKQR